jgi:hypothetical protein
MTHHACLAQTTFPQDVSDRYQDHSLDNAATSCTPALLGLVVGFLGDGNVEGIWIPDAQLQDAA